MFSIAATPASRAACANHRRSSSRRALVPRAAANHVCTETGDDCPCWHKAESRPPLVTPKRPIKQSIEPGKSVYGCMCGQSTKYPFCDGSHKAFNTQNGTSIGPKPITNDGEEAKSFLVCQCGHSNILPQCDLTHKKVRVLAQQ